MTEPGPGPPSSPFRNQNIWLWALGALVLAGIAAVLIFQAVDDDDGDNGGSATVATTVETLGPPPAPPPPADRPPPESTTGQTTTNPGGPEPVPIANSGTLVANNQNLYPFLPNTLAQFANSQATGKNVPIESIVNDETIWVGIDKSQRLLLRINLKGQAPPKLSAGQRVDFFAAMIPNPEGATETFGVTKEEDKTLLDRQGYHGLVSVNDLKVR
jgi:hypothetical protein